MKPQNNDFGYICPFTGSIVYLQEGRAFLAIFDMLLELSETSERVWRLSDDVTFVYSRKNGDIGINCGSDFFYELIGDSVFSVQPDTWDKFGNGRCGEYFLEYDPTDSTRIVNQIKNASDSLVAEYIGAGLTYIGEWKKQLLFRATGVGVITLDTNGNWRTLFSPTMSRAKYAKILGDHILVFGNETNRKACCEIFDLVAKKAIGIFTFDHHPGYTSDIYRHEKGWYFQWGSTLFHFNGEVVEQVLPGRTIGGFYLNAQGICIFFEDESAVRLYDHELKHVRDEIAIPLPEYSFSSLHAEKGKMVGYLRAPSHDRRLIYALTLTIRHNGCPRLELEQPLFQVEKREHGEVFDLLINFSGEAAFSKLLRQSLAALDDGLIQYYARENNPDAARFSGCIELHFGGPLSNEEKELLQHGCQRIYELVLGREAPSTGKSYSFHLIFSE
ncbi:hypothetical protein Pstr01_20230 [Pseudomonas straminea]|uniref:Uncharacterized protein n=1 Tax=Pseudomonas straminea TaxID=47882 RepID=A0A1I1V4Y5_PSEOC|nr:hypothetical protein [Pseudomonas straminea]GLX13784.1 hypothetical protein Pstr01_20230 [Pseudomonas straminea]SFD77078.1 hypothetical protein SAMN05216372_10423 [Pseudomonas straminea]